MLFFNKLWRTFIVILFFRRKTFLKKNKFIERESCIYFFIIYLTWTDNIHLFVGENQVGIAPRLLHFILLFLSSYQIITQNVKREEKIVRIVNVR
jgi:hypothetical protein